MQLGHDPKQVAEYLLCKAKDAGKSLTPMQILKLVYIAHGWNLGLYGNPLINESVEAWQYGPVIPSLYHAYKRFGSSPIDDCPGAGPNEFGNDERRVMDQVWSGYGSRSGISLSTLTHQPGSPWFISYNEQGRGATISNDLIEDHYRRLSEARR